MGRLLGNRTANGKASGETALQIGRLLGKPYFKWEGFWRNRTANGKASGETVLQMGRLLGKLLEIKCAFNSSRELRSQHIFALTEQEYLSRYSDRLRAGRPGFDYRQGFFSPT
jgi:hypothetical protein